MRSLLFACRLLMLFEDAYKRYLFQADETTVQLDSENVLSFSHLILLPVGITIIESNASDDQDLV